MGKVLSPDCVADFAIYTGKLFFTNFFSDADPTGPEGLFPHKDSNQNYLFQTAHFAAKKIMYGACLNDCPGIWVSYDRTKIIIGKAVYDDDGKLLKGFEKYNRKGQVVTDRWCWAAADLHTAIQYPEIRLDGEFIHVVAGTYRFTQLFHRLPERYDMDREPHIFATIEKVGEL